MGKYTPGPWRWIGDGLFGGCYSQNGIEHTRYQIHPFYDCDRTKGTHGVRHEADKSLVAAAPDLLDILETIVEDVGYGGGGAKLCEHYLGRAKAAISKAKGESNEDSLG